MSVCWTYSLLLCVYVSFPLMFSSVSCTCKSVYIYLLITLSIWLSYFSVCFCVIPLKASLLVCHIPCLPAVILHCLSYLFCLFVQSLCSCISASLCTSFTTSLLVFFCIFIHLLPSVSICWYMTRQSIFLYPFLCLYFFIIIGSMLENINSNCCRHTMLSKLDTGDEAKTTLNNAAQRQSILRPQFPWQRHAFKLGGIKHWKSVSTCSCLYLISM